MRPAEFAAASVLLLSGATILAVAASGPPEAAAPVRPDDRPAASAPARPAPNTPDPRLGELKLRIGRKRLIYIYEPTVAPDPDALAVLYFSGDWGWRPLQQETSTYLAGKGRHVVGFDSSEYFDRQIGPADWASDLATLRAYANEQAGKPRESPVLLIGFTFGGELIPYMLNRGGIEGFAGALLVSLDLDGAVIYRTAIQLKLPLPPEEVFSVAEEIHRLPPTFPVFLMDGALDAGSGMRALVDLVRGPKRSVTIDGADRQFRRVRDAYFNQVVRALAWLEQQRPGAGRAAPAGTPRDAGTPGHPPAPEAPEPPEPPGGR